MNPQPLEIYQLGPIRWRDCEDARPCVILDPPRRNRVTVALISGSDLYQGPPTHFLIEESHRASGDTTLYFLRPSLPCLRRDDTSCRAAVTGK